MNRLAQCGSCRHEFEVEPRFVGGLVSCPRCSKFVDVPGTRDPLWRLLVGAGVVAAVVAGALVGRAHGGVSGVATGAALLGVGFALTRAL